MSLAMITIMYHNSFGTHALRNNPQTLLSHVFCHNDLSGHNIILNPETYEIVGIVDWEYAGFFPHWFERELWKKRYTEREEEEERTFVKSAEEFFRDGV